jgi:HSP20 family protein
MWNLIPWKKPNGNGGALAVEPFEREFNRIRDEFDSLLSRMWSGMPAFGDGLENRFGWGPEVEETDSHYVARLPAPGFEIGDFDVHVAGNHLVVKAERKESQEAKNGGAAYRYGRVQQMIPLPEGTDADQIDANYRNGVLELKLPKGKESHARRITIKAG